MNPGFLLVLSLIIQIISGSITKTVMPAFYHSNVYEYIFIPFSTLISIFLPSYLYLKKNKKKNFTDFREGVKPDRFLLIAFAAGLCTQFAAIAANLPINILINRLGGEVASKIPEVGSVSALFFALISFAIIPALCEEVLFRGIILGYFRKYGDKPAVIISSVLFALMHLSVGNTLGTFVMGLVFGLLFVSSNRLIYPFTAHLALNASAVFITYFGKTNPIISTFYEDYIIVFILVSLPLGVYLLKIFSESVEKRDYSDTDKYNYVSEFVFDIDENNCIKIYEHDIKENNLKLAFAELIKSPYFYIIIIIFAYLGGNVLW